MKRHRLVMPGNTIIILALYVGLGPPGTVRVLPALVATEGSGLQAPSSSVWAPLPNGGLDGQVFALALKGDDLYVGGHFDQTADGAVRNLNNIAVLRGGVWSGLPHNGLTISGRPAEVSVLAVVGDDLYVGGTFTQTADGAVQSLNNIAVLRNGTWQALPHGGLNDRVLALAFNGSDLYVGGRFSATADGVVKDLGLIARYNLAGWTPLPNGGLFQAEAVYNLVSAIAFHGSDVIVGGTFTQTSDSSTPNLNNIARLSGGAWQSLPNGGLGDINSSVTAVAFVGDELYVGGQFHTTADGLVPDLNSIARLSAGTWSALPHQGIGAAFHFPPSVSALTVHGTDLYVGGFFDQTHDGLLTGLSLIAKLSGGEWIELSNGGLAGSAVDSIAISGNRLFAGGGFGATADVQVRSLNQVAVLYLANFPQFLPVVSR